MCSIAVLGSASTGSYIVASLTAAAAVAGPVVGALIDRAKSPRLGFTISIAAMAGGIAALALALGHVPVPALIALAVVAGLGYPALTGAWSAQIPGLVDPTRLRHAYSADAATYSVAAVVAPPAATALIALGSTAPLWLTVGLLLVAMIGLRMVPLPSRRSTRPDTSLRTDLAEGLRTMLGLPALRRSTIITTVGFAGQAAIFVAAPILAQRDGRGLEFTGVILGTFAVGGLLSAAWFARHPVERPDRAIIVCTILSGVFLLAVGLAPTTLLLLAFAFAMGASEPPLVSAMFQVRVRESPPSVQGQVFTTSASLRMTAFAVATAVCGWLLGPGIAWVIGFGVLLHAVSLALGLLLGPTIPHRRQWLRRA